MVVVLQKVGDLLLDVGGCSIPPPEVSNLWVIMDSTPSFQAHFKSISKSTCFFFFTIQTTSPASPAVVCCSGAPSKRQSPEEAPICAKVTCQYLMDLLQPLHPIPGAAVLRL